MEWRPSAATPPWALTSPPQPRRRYCRRSRPLVMVTTSPFVAAKQSQRTVFWACPELCRATVSSIVALLDRRRRVLRRWRDLLSPLLFSLSLYLYLSICLFLSFFESFTAGEEFGVGGDDRDGGGEDHWLGRGVGREVLPGCEGVSRGNAIEGNASWVAS